MKYILVMEIDSDRERRITRCCGIIRKGGGVISEARLRREWFAVDRLKQFSDRLMMRVLRQLFQAQINDIVRRIRRGDISRRLRYEPQIVTKDSLLAQQLFSAGLWDVVLLERLTPSIIEAISKGFQTGLDRVGGLTGISFSQSLPQASEALRDILEQTKSINITTQNSLAVIINEWITTPGLDEEDLISMVQAGTGFSRARALKIGRTTGGGSFESGQQEAFVKAGVEQKRWLTERDNRVRVKPFSHVAADGEEVSIDSVFIRTGEPMRFPLDPNGSAANVINCRCSSLPLIRVDR